MKKVKEIKNIDKKYFKWAGIGAAVVVLVVLLFMAFKPCCKVALVNVEQVVAVSPAIEALRAERQNEMVELQKFLENANTEINKLSGQKKAEMKQAYGEELAQKQQAMQDKYNEKLRTIDQDMTNLIEKVAKKKGFKLVLSKTSVVLGGTDITEDVIKAIQAK